MNSAQEQEVTFISGVTAQGADAVQSFWTWNRDSPATYGSNNGEAKWGPAQAGSGAEVTVSFDTASNWTATEKAGFVASMHLWSEVANVRFTVVDGSGAEIDIKRGSDHSADEDSGYYSGTIGTTTLGTLTDGTIGIDTRSYGFGPLGGSFAAAGGYPWEVMEHELGHALGLGHSGAYNDGETTSDPMLTGYDTRGWSIMSYNDPADGNHSQAIGGFNWGNSADGALRVPITPMVLDIAAIQRVYGTATDTPLSGGQTFGFHSNVQGDTAQFFDFTRDPTPVVTLWDAGGGNTLDLSGYSMGNYVDLHDGAYSSVGGLASNVGIAFGTRIDACVGGSGFDNIKSNDDGDVIQGGAGNDILSGGSGNDHIYGNMQTGAAGATDGDDTIDAGGGTDYVNGNGGNDKITVHGDASRVLGGQGNDQIEVDSGVNHVNGNLGDDQIYMVGGKNDVRGGQGNDFLNAQAGDNVMNGDLGNDTLSAGSGVDVMTGGEGRDAFVFGTGNPSPLYRSGDLAGYHDEITDFTHGQDLLTIYGNYDNPRDVLHGPAFSSSDGAEQYAQSLLDGDRSAVAVLQVGSDTYLFWNALGTSSPVDTAVKLDAMQASQVVYSDFSW